MRFSISTSSGHDMAVLWMITASCWRAITVALGTGAVSRYPDLDASAHAQTFGRSHNAWRKGNDMDEMDRSQVPPCCVQQKNLSDWRTCPVTAIPEWMWQFYFSRKTYSKLKGLTGKLIRNTRAFTVTTFVLPLSKLLNSPDRSSGAAQWSTVEDYDYTEQLGSAKELLIQPSLWSWKIAGFVLTAAHAAKPASINWLIQSGFAGKCHCVLECILGYFLLKKYPHFTCNIAKIYNLDC